MSCRAIRLPLLIVVAAAGCSSGPTKVSVPIVDESSAASGALELCDKDGDGAISKDESAAAPSLKAEFASFDANKDDKLDRIELENRIASWTTGGIARVIPMSFYVKLDGRPLADAKVVLEPEPFMGGVLPPAESMTSGSGSCGPTVARELLSKEIPVGMFSGLYRVKVTHPQKSIPAKYNDQTELGIEVSPNYDFYNRRSFDLKSS